MDKSKPSEETDESVIEVVPEFSEDAETDLFEHSFEYSDDSACTQIENITLTDSADVGLDVSESLETPRKRRDSYRSSLEKTFVISKTEDKDEPTTTTASERGTAPAAAAGGGDAQAQIVEGTKSFQQEEFCEWELKAFKANFENYMDNDSMEEDGRPEALRSALIQTGNHIGSPCTFLVHLYITKEDENENYSYRDWNVKQGNIQIEPMLPLFLEVEVRLVEAETSQGVIFSNFTVDISGGDLGFICKMDRPISEWSVGTVMSAHHRIEDWGSIMAKLAPDESLFVDLRHIVYLDPSQWGLGSQKDVALIRKFMEHGEVDWGCRYVYRDILRGCNERRLSGVIECYDRVIAVCELDDTVAGSVNGHGHGHNEMSTILINDNDDTIVGSGDNKTIMVDDDYNESVVVIEEPERVLFQQRATTT